MNQKELAKAVGIDVTYLSKIETGKMDPPAEATVRSLANALEANYTELLILAKKIPADVREIVTTTPEVSYFLRTAKEQQWGTADWRRAREAMQKQQPSLFDASEDDVPPEENG